MLEHYLTQKDRLPKLKRYAALGKNDSFRKKLNYLTTLAEPEKWHLLDEASGYENTIIYQYIFNTFDRCFMQGKIYIDQIKENSFFNTGLMDSQGNEIMGHFTKSELYNEFDCNSNYWFFNSFIKANDRDFLSKCKEKPEIATYYDDFNETYFNPNLEIELNFDHIYDDNYSRLPDELRLLDKEMARQVFLGFVEYAKKKIKRNDRIVVPQYYKNKITFLIPIIIFNNKTVIVAVERINNVYIGNTVLTKEMAYNCARLINKQETNWLLSES